MKRKIGTAVLFGLLILTIIALTKIDPAHTSAKPSATTTAQRINN